jgi:hypothetical protein
MFWMSLGISLTTVELVGLGIPGVNDKGVVPSPSMEPSPPCAYLCVCVGVWLLVLDCIVDVQPWY